MNCKHCDYPLWNLLSRQCPECGAPFRPSEYRFALNSVRFCCPHCGQPYYGTGEEGHLSPSHFVCVGCEAPIDMDEMRLLPTEGVDERLTKPDLNPWLDPDRRFLGRWFATLFRGMTNPMWLMRSTPVDAGAATAWFFAVFSHVVFGIVGAAPIFLLVGFAGFSRGAAALTGTATSVLVYVVSILVASTIGLGLWVVTAHAVVRMAPAHEGGIGRTAQALCYTCGSQSLLAIPCINFYVGWLGGLWWVITAGFAVAASQRVSGVRAALAVGLLPGFIAIAGLGWIGYGVASSISASSTTSWSTAGSADLSAFQPVISRAVAQGTGPTHAGEFMIDGSLAPSDFVSLYSHTTTADATIAGVTLDAFGFGAAQARLAAVDRAAGAREPGRSAHRVGDYVFVLDALAYGAANPELWVVLEWWDPAIQHGAGQAQMHILTAGGVIVSVPAARAPGLLGAQNEARAALGLPPIPDPATLRAE